MIRNIVNLSSKLPVNPVLVRATGIPTPSVMLHQNPILHQSNRIVTVGLLSSYGQPKKGNGRTSSTSTFATNPATTTTDINKTGTDFKALPTLSIQNKECGNFIFKYSYSYKNAFVEAYPKALPGSTKAFDWGNKLVMKLGLAELGKLLTVLTSTQENALVTYESTKDGLKDTFVMTLEKAPKDGCFKLFASKKSATEDKSVYVELTQSDAALFIEFIRNSIRSGLGFE